METTTAQSEITELQGKYLQKFVGNWKIESKDSPTEYVTIKPIKNDLGVEVYAKWINTENMITLEAYGFWGYDREIDKIDISMFLSDGNTIHCLGSFKSENELEFQERGKTEPYLQIRTYNIKMNSDDNLYETVTSLSANLKEEYHWTRIN
jgi:hypothetical protein